MVRSSLADTGCAVADRVWVRMQVRDEVKEHGHARVPALLACFGSPGPALTDTGVASLRRGTDGSKSKPSRALLPPDDTTRGVGGRMLATESQREAGQRHAGCAAARPTSPQARTIGLWVTLGSSTVHCAHRAFWEPQGTSP